MGEIIPPGHDLPDSACETRPSLPSPVVKFVGFVFLFNALLWVFGLFVQIRGWVDLATSYLLLGVMWVIGVSIAFAFAFQGRIAHRKLAVVAASVVWGLALVGLNTIAKPPRAANVANAVVPSQARTSQDRSTSALPTAPTSPPKKETQSQGAAIGDKTGSDERAWVEIDRIERVQVSARDAKFGAAFRYRLYLKNAGKTVARNISVSAARNTIGSIALENNVSYMRRAQDGLLARSGLDPVDNPVPKTLAPQMAAPVPFVMDGQEPRVFGTDEWVSFLIGRIDYADDNGISHWTKFCYYVAESNGNLWNCHVGNDEDRNSREVLRSPKKTLAVPVSRQVKSSPMLKDLFFTDFNAVVKMRSSEPLNLTVNSTNVQIWSQAYFDFDSKSEFVGFFIPSAVAGNTYAVCAYLATLDHANALKHTGTKALGGRIGQMTYQDDLTFTGRVYIYHETDLSIEQRATLVQIYRDHHLDVQFMGTDYWLMQTLARQSEKRK